MGPRIAGGRTAEVFAWRDGEVIKVLRPGFPDGLGEEEAIAAARVTAAGLAAPRFLGTRRVEGRFGLVYERVDGPSMVEEIWRSPWRSTPWAVQLADLHAAMHEERGTGLPDGLAGLREAIEHGARRLGEPVRDAALARLEALPRGDALVHGDLHPGNVLMTRNGPVVIDWLTAAFGPPAADVARTLFLLTGSVLGAEFSGPRRWMIELIRRRFASAYLRRYRALRPLDPDEVRAWRLPILAARAAEGVDGEDATLPTQIARELR
jgi:aminoglycoside phosphotransferase (APT) family kinase protein